MLKVNVVNINKGIIGKERCESERGRSRRKEGAKRNRRMRKGREMDVYEPQSKDCRGKGYFFALFVLFSPLLFPDHLKATV